MGSDKAMLVRSVHNELIGQLKVLLSPNPNELLVPRFVNALAHLLFPSEELYHSESVEYCRIQLIASMLLRLRRWSRTFGDNLHPSVRFLH